MNVPSKMVSHMSNEGRHHVLAYSAFQNWIKVLPVLLRASQQLFDVASHLRW